MSEPGPQGRELSASLTASGEEGTPIIHAASKPESTRGHLPIIFADDDAEKTSTHGGQDNVLFDVGWDKDEAFEDVDIVDGLDTEDFWTLVRRFNKVKQASSPAMLSLTCVSKSSMSRKHHRRPREVWISKWRPRRTSPRTRCVLSLRGSTWVL